MSATRTHSPPRSALRLGACLCAALAAPASGGEPFPAETLPAAELERLRGGFSLRGLEFELGANVRTFFNDRPVLETVVTWNEAGMQSRTTPLTTGLGTSDWAAAAASLPELDLRGLAGAQGVAFDGPGGPTAALHQVTPERIVGVLVSRAHGQALRQEIDVDVTVHNFSRFQEAARAALLTQGLGRSATTPP